MRCRCIAACVRTRRATGGMFSAGVFQRRAGDGALEDEESADSAGTSEGRQADRRTDEGSKREVDQLRPMNVEVTHVYHLCLHV